MRRSASGGFLTKRDLQGAVVFALLVGSVAPSCAVPLALAIDPFSWSAFFISLALSAASYAVQRIFGPKPPKQTRGQMSGEVFVQNADEGNPIPEIYGGAPARAVRTPTWAGLTNATVQSDNSVLKTTGADNCFTNASGSGDAGARSVETIASGDFELSFSFATTPGEGRNFCGLTTSGSYTTDYTQLAYCIHVSDQNNTSGTPHPPHSIFIYESGTGRAISAALQDGTYTAGDTLRITCESGVVKYWHKSNLLYTSGVAPTYPLRVGASLACLNKTVDNVSITTPGEDTKGGIKTAGTVIWCKAPRKVVTTEKKGGKGAPKQTVETITYYTDLAILFARGPLRLKKLWANADLIIDLDAGIGSATGAIDSNSSGATTYNQGTPPAVATDTTPRTFWGIRLTPDANGTLSGTVGAGGGASMRFYEGNYDQLPDSLIEAEEGAGNAPAYRGFAYLVIENFDISKYGGVPTFLATLENVEYQDLQQIADHLCERVGIEPQDKSFSVFAGQTVRGLLVSQPQAPRQTLEFAAIPYQAQFFETVDGQLTGSYLGSASVVTVDEDYLGMVEGDATSTAGDMGDKIEFRTVDEIQVPRQVTLTAFDPFKDHETTTQSAYRMTGFARSVNSQTLPMALSPDETRQAAERVLYQQHVERESAAVKLPWVYAWVNPCDVITVPADGHNYRLRLAQMSGAVPGVLEFQLPADELDVYSQTISGDSGGGYTSPSVTVPVESLAFLIDSVTLRDGDDKAGFYAAVTPKSMAAGWGGAVLYRDRGAGYEVVDRFLGKATIGVTTGAVTSQDPAVWDETTTITIDLYDTSATLESLTEAQVLNGGNAAILGDNQVIQFQTATQVGGYPNRWTLSRLLWGRRGSDHSAGTFAAGSRFILLDGAVQFVENTLSERGTARNFKAVTAGFSINDTASTSFTWDANILKPLSVVDVQGSRDGGNNLTITWVRRSRIAHEAPYSGASLPLGEETESYEIDVYNGPTVVRTITATSETASYTAAEQTTDFGSPQASLTIKIYQISASVGRGFERSATI